MKILYHLVSGQNAQIFIADRIIKPDLNIFLYTEASKEQLNIIKSLTNTDLKEILIPAFNYEEVVNTISSDLNNYQSDEIIANFTGGTKIQSVALFEEFKQRNFETIYVNSEANEIIHFDKNGHNNVEKNSVNISPKTYFQLQGQKVKYLEKIDNIDSEEYKLVKVLADNLTEFKSFILHVAGKYQSQNDIINEHAKQNNIKGSFVKYVNDQTEIKLVLSGNVLYHEQKNGYDLIDQLRGKWFEKAVALKIKELNLFDKLAINIEIDWQNEKLSIKFNKNEFDILAMKGTYPFLFECKSGKIENNDVQKLGAIKNYLGRYSSLFFVTNKVPPHAILEMIKDNNIEILYFDDLENSLMNSKLMKANLL